MKQRFSLPPNEKEKIFCSELIKQGVPYEKALRASRILTSWLDDQPLAPEEMQLAKEVCKEWLKQRKRWDALATLVSNIGVQSSHLEPQAQSKSVEANR